MTTKLTINAFYKTSFPVLTTIATTDSLDEEPLRLLEMPTTGHHVDDALAELAGRVFKDRAHR